MVTRIALSAGSVFALAVLTGCTIDVPQLPEFGGLDFLDELQSRFNEAIQDPLRTNPFPVLIGGSRDQVYYATSLTDVRLNFAGRTNDLVIPSFIGPSNLYQYEAGERTLVRPLIPASAFFGLASDGEWITYARVDNIIENPAVVVVVSGPGPGSDEIVFDSAAEGVDFVPDPGRRPIAVANDRLAFRVREPDTGRERIRILDLAGVQPEREVEGLAFGSVALRGNLLAYAESMGDDWRVVIRDLAAGTTTLIAEQIRVYSAPAVFLTENRVVWTEPASFDSARVSAYDIPTAITRVWVDLVSGQLAGATDTYLVMEHQYVNDNGVGRIAVRRIDSEGMEKELADFRFDGLAGQSQVIGDQAAWVNPDRKVVLAPLAGGDRISFRPF